MLSTSTYTSTSKAKSLFRKIVFLFALAISTLAQSQRLVTANGVEIDLQLASSTPGPVILYVPGCNGLDVIGRAYQAFHKEEIRKRWPETHLVLVQAVNMLTQGSQMGACDWKNDHPKYKAKGIDSPNVHFVEQIKVVREWINQQPWAQQQAVHLFGFSAGGSMGMHLAGNKSQFGVFKSIALIWPTCINSDKLKLGNLHTPTKIWATESDPLSRAQECHKSYEGGHELLELHLWPGDLHSWMTHPMVPKSERFWPRANVTVKHQFVKEYNDKTWDQWVEWAKSK